MYKVISVRKLRTQNLAYVDPLVAEMEREAALQRIRSQQAFGYHSYVFCRRVDELIGCQVRAFEHVEESLTLLKALSNGIRSFLDHKPEPLSQLDHIAYLAVERSLALLNAEEPSGNMDRVLEAIDTICVKNRIALQSFKDSFQIINVESRRLQEKPGDAGHKLTSLLNLYSNYFLENDLPPLAEIMNVMNRYREFINSDFVIAVLKAFVSELSQKVAPPSFGISSFGCLTIFVCQFYTRLPLFMGDISRNLSHILRHGKSEIDFESLERNSRLMELRIRSLLLAINN